MPEQFLMRYDYEFMWTLRIILMRFRNIIPNITNFQVHSVAEELIFYLIMEESRDLMEEMKPKFENESDYEDWDGWVFKLFDDMDIVTFLYSDLGILNPCQSYHFDNWFKQQFYITENTDENG